MNIDAILRKALRKWTEQFQPPEDGWMRLRRCIEQPENRAAPFPYLARAGAQACSEGSSLSPDDGLFVGAHQQQAGISAQGIELVTSVELLGIRPGNEDLVENSGGLGNETAQKDCERF